MRTIIIYTLCISLFLSIIGNIVMLTERNNYRNLALSTQESLEECVGILIDDPTQGERFIWNYFSGGRWIVYPIIINGDTCLRTEILDGKSDYELKK